MDVKDKTIEELKRQIDKLKQDCGALKYNYNEEKEANVQLSQRLDRILNDKVQLIAQRNDMQNKIEILQTEVERLKPLQQKLHPVQVEKLWKDLKRRAQFKRKIQYKDILDVSLRNITECKRAKMTLTLGKEDIHLKWTEQEMSDMQKQLNEGSAFAGNSPSEQNSDINVEGNDESNANIDTPPLTNTDDVFDEKCKFTKRHKRTIITVMDNHRVSHKAYHAMRKAGKGNWPSLNMIKKEKGKMSKEIKFTTNDEVRFEI